ncbi:HlyC/CorC family transporter [Mammaliicoccus sciuri]|mgnify:CR=1 FL=1|uniref:HlyC/CorC family transporter n=1 Tax=Mammaliicoccus sciuri TaxID=1296 RepID=A0AAI8DIA7_MAMSC|nr:hemolysin family protein [Mammaliicoccus sciuri]PCQ20276.1 HlyC/CorC family transporter [Klebsiella pneumoniae]ASE34961.1 HlyC/CorC family transporter [Mammaliicoccus sciuri]KTT86049.1 hemolysin [Mammaliicoccus sciuri]KTT86716.1 hemolysin [Mammaliicoccus sciuri]KTT89121.1 hemolysin [Mammaliicoccus sciuri]
MGTTISLITFIVLLALTGFFVATEFAIVKVRSSRINYLAEQNYKNAQPAKKVVEHLDEYLAACQLGITITALGIGMVGESTFEFILHPLYSSFGLSESVIHILTLASAFIIATYLHVVVGEMAPKTIAIQKAEQVTLFFARPIILFYKLLYPFIFILNGSARMILSLFGMKPAKESELYHSEEELKMLIKESHQGGEISSTELEHINKVFIYDELVVKDCMISRDNMTMINSKSSQQEAIQFVKNGYYTRYPVYQDDKTNVIGYIHAKDLLKDNIQDITELIHEIIYVKETDAIQNVLDKMKKQRAHIAIVHNEDGQLAGMITMEDILENIVGNIEDEHDK